VAEHIPLARKADNQPRPVREGREAKRCDGGLSPQEHVKYRPTTALKFLAALRAGEFDRAACGAVIVERRNPQLGDQAFRVRLDADVPFKLADPPNKEGINQKEVDIEHNPG
jgi:hypothetical protein